MARMARRRAPSWLPLAPVTFCAAGAAAAGMSLSNFQLITSTSVPLGCILAYNQPLVGCTIGDFTQGGGPGATCSQQCQRGILSTQRTLQLVCEDSGAPTNSVLGQAVLGNLISLLCGGAPSAAPAAASSAAVAGAAATQAPTTAAEPPAPPSDDASADSPPPDPTPVQVPPPSAVGAAETAETTETSSSLSPPTDMTGARQTTAPSPPKLPQTDSARGGGSPFDAVVNGSAGRVANWRGALLVFLSIGLSLSR